MEDQIFIQSRLIDPDEARKNGAFTTLPIRIHKRNDIADETARRVLRDWGHHVGDGMEKKALTSFSHLGNLNAFTYTEALPERRGVLSYLLDLGLIHDGTCSTYNLVSKRVKLILLVPQMPPKGWA